MRARRPVMRSRWGARVGRLAADRCGRPAAHCRPALITQTAVPRTAVPQTAVPPTAVHTDRRRSEPMPAPNQGYDPVEVAALSPEELQRMQAEALAAIAAATDLDQLKSARLAH